MRFPKFVMAIAGVSLLTVSSVSAQELTGTLKKIKDSGVIAIGHRDSSVPFSYFDEKQQVVGYAHDICMKLADGVKQHLGLQKLEVKLVPITSATRIPLMENGTIDIECGSTTNNLERQKQVTFSYTHFVTASRFISKKANNFKTIEDLKGKTVVSTAGTSNIKLLTEINNEKKLGMTIIAAKDHADGFLMVQTDRASAFVMDDILMAAFAANSKNPEDYVISKEAFSVEPYGSMIRKNDPEFKKVVDNAFMKLFKDGTVAALYDKWFMKPIPPKGITLNVPMSNEFKQVMAKPTDSGDPKDYIVK